MIESDEKRYPENSPARLLKVCLQAIDYQPSKQIDEILTLFQNVPVTAFHNCR
jgi:hypothetical protein